MTKARSCHTAIVVAGLFSLPASNGFITTPEATSVHKKPSTLPMSNYERGWDNDNFLDSLGSAGGASENDGNPTEAMDRANDEYFRQSRYGRPSEWEGGNPPSPGNNSFPPMAGSTRYSQTLQEEPSPDPAAEVYAYSYGQNLDSANPNPPTIVDTTSVPAEDNEDIDSPRDELPTEEIEGASLSKDMIATIKARNEDDREESSQGGSRFRTLMARAKEGEENGSISGQRQPNPLLQQEGIVPPSSIMTPEEIANLSIDEQARLYREFFYVQQQRQQPTKSIGSTDSNYLEPGIGFDGKKIGRNKDADAISNAADVYFARLKRDSTTRNLARYRGDDSTANSVFHDPSIPEIQAPVNPYLEEQRKKMMDVIETAPEEMLIFQEYEEEAPAQPPPQTNSGISYRERMAKIQEERRQRQQNQQNGGNF